jgi:hypothetical protein
MRLEEYLQQEVDKVVAKLIADAPADLCCACSSGCGCLTYDGQHFKYVCDHCGVEWPSDNLDIDADRKFAILEFAD